MTREKPGAERPRVNIGTIGHTGHGKTTLCAAITRALSLEGPTRFTSFDRIADTAVQAAGAIKVGVPQVKYRTAERRYLHMDCPARELRKAVLGGAVDLDGAILVVDSLDGAMPETRDHLQLMRQAGVPAVVVFLNESDSGALDAELAALLEDQVRGMLDQNGFPADSTPIVQGNALRALTCENPDPAAEEYRPIRELLKEVDEQIGRRPETRKPLLMTVERVSPKEGPEIVVSGRVERGTLRPGDRVEILGPRAQVFEAAVTSLRRSGEPVDEVREGDEADCGLEGPRRSEIEVGQVLAEPGSIRAHSVFMAAIYLARREEGGRHEPILGGEDGQQFRTWGLPVSGEIRLPEGLQMVMPGDHVEARVGLFASVALEPGVRFTVEDGVRTLGAGIVTKILQ